MALHIEALCSGGEKIKHYVSPADVTGFSQENMNGLHNGVIIGCDLKDRDGGVFLIEDMEYPMDAITLSQWPELCITENLIEHIQRGKESTLTAERLGFSDDADYRKIVVKHMASWFGICFGEAFRNRTPLEQGWLRGSCPSPVRETHHY